MNATDLQRYHVWAVCGDDGDGYTYSDLDIGKDADGDWVRYHDVVMLLLRDQEQAKVKKPHD